MEKTNVCVISEKDFIDKAATVAARLTKKLAEEAKDPMLGVMVMMLAAELQGELRKEMFQDEEEEEK